MDNVVIIPVRPLIKFSRTGKKNDHKMQPFDCSLAVFIQYYKYYYMLFYNMIILNDLIACNTTIYFFCLFVLPDTVY